MINKSKKITSVTILTNFHPYFENQNNQQTLLYNLVNSIIWHFINLKEFTAVNIIAITDNPFASPVYS